MRRSWRSAPSRIALRAAVVTAAALAPLACGGDDTPDAAPPAAPATVRLASTAFRDGGTIPTRFTCSGQDVSPPLAIQQVPKRARALALVMEDPDAEGFVHWMVLAIPPDTALIREGTAPAGSVEVENSFGRRRYGGPCPPEGDGPHRYVFTLYAVDGPLGVGADASPDEVYGALDDHAIGRGTLTGRFGR